MAAKKKTAKPEATINPAVESEFTAASRIALNEYTAKAKALGQTPTDGGVQMTLAVWAFQASKAAVKAKKEFDFNSAIFCPFAANYYGVGKGGKREKLEGFSADGKHTPKKSADTQLRAYNKFVALGALPIDVRPVVIGVLGDARIGSLSMTAKAKLATEIVAAGKGHVPTPELIGTMVEAEIPSKGKVNAVQMIKGFASSADRIAKNKKFWGALAKLDNADKVTAALAHAMHFAAIARGMVDTTKASTDKNVLLNGFIETHATAEYKAAVKAGASVH